MYGEQDSGETGVFKLDRDIDSLVREALLCSCLLDLYQGVTFPFRRGKAYIPVYRPKYNSHELIK